MEERNWTALMYGADAEVFPVYVANVVCPACLSACHEDCLDSDCECCNGKRVAR